MDLTVLPIAPTGAIGILCVVILLILKGQLIPRSTHEDRVRDKDQQIEYLRAINAELVAQNNALLEVGHTAEKVLVSLHEAAATQSEGGQREVASS